MALPVAGLYARYRHLVPELLKFGTVGGIGAVIDLGGAAVLHGKYHVGPLGAKAISTIVATVFTYLGSRFWTFRHRENQALGREAGLFIVLNVIGLLIAEAVVALVTYGLGRHSQLEYNAASVVGTGLATIFRYFAYRQWVFTAPAQQTAPASADRALEPIPDYPPWEGDPAYLAAEVMAPAPAPAAAGWDSPDTAAPAWPSDPWPSDGWPSDGWRSAAEPQQSWDAPAEHRSREQTSVLDPWGRLDEPTQPWQELSDFSNARVASPVPPRSATGADLSGGADSAAVGARGQGRHRRS